MHMVVLVFNIALFPLGYHYSITVTINVVKNIAKGHYHYCH